MKPVIAHLERTISKVMTDMFFVCRDEKTPGSQAGEMTGETHGCEIRLETPGKGQMLLYFLFSAPLGSTMAQNFMGLEGPVDRVMLDGTLRECTNTVVGNLLDVIDADGAMVVGLPQSTESTPAWVEGPADLSLFFEGRELKTWLKEQPAKTNF